MDFVKRLMIALVIAIGVGAFCYAQGQRREWGASELEQEAIHGLDREAQAAYDAFKAASDNLRPRYVKVMTSVRQRLEGTAGLGSGTNIDYDRERHVFFEVAPVSSK